MYDAKGSVLGDPGEPNSPASAASRYFLAPQAKIWRFLRPRWRISRQNGTPGLSTGKTKVVRNLALSIPIPLDSTLLNGKVLGFNQGSQGPPLASYIPGGSRAPWSSPRYDTIKYHGTEHLHVRSGGCVEDSVCVYCDI